MGRTCRRCCGRTGSAESVGGGQSSVPRRWRLSCVSVTQRHRPTWDEKGSTNREEGTLAAGGQTARHSGRGGHGVAAGGALGMLTIRGGGGGDGGGTRSGRPRRDARVAVRACRRTDPRVPARDTAWVLGRRRRAAGRDVGVGWAPCFSHCFVGGTLLGMRTRGAPIEPRAGSVSGTYCPCRRAGRRRECYAARRSRARRVWG